MQLKPLATSVLLGIVVFAVIAYLVGVDQVISIAARLEPDWLAIAIVLEAASLLVLFARWQVILDASGHRTNPLTTALINLAGQAVNHLVPSSRLGGEPVRAYFLKKKYGLQLGIGVASIVIEKISDLAAFTGIAIAAAVYAFYFLNVPGHIVGLLAASVAFTFLTLVGVSYFAVIRRIKSKTILNFLAKHRAIAERIPLVSQYRERLGASLMNYYSHVARITTTPGIWRAGIVFSLVFWAIEVLRAYALFRAAGTDVPLAVIAAAVIVSAVLASLPLLPGNVGVTEGAMIVIYSTSSIPTATAGIVTMMDRLLSYWLVVLAGVPVAAYLGFDKR
jgi:uncharacterized protein (TIRG00374 family)